MPIRSSVHPQQMHLWLMHRRREEMERQTYPYRPINRSNRRQAPYYQYLGNDVAQTINHLRPEPAHSNQRSGRLPIEPMAGMPQYFVDVLDMLQARRRGATREQIERTTFAHKYKQRENQEEDESSSAEECSICLCNYQNDEDVR